MLVFVLVLLDSIVDGALESDANTPALSESDHSSWDNTALDKLSSGESIVTGTNIIVYLNQHASVERVLAIAQ